MRLVDVDALIAEYDRVHVGKPGGARKLMVEAPIIDAVPVIRCKDCIYWKRYCRVVDGVTSHHVCGRKRELDGAMHRSKADDFCSWAERKDMYVTLHHEDIHFIDEDAEKIFYESLAEREEE